LSACSQRFEKGHDLLQEGADASEAVEPDNDVFLGDLPVINGITSG
jgi:hypothetical protein